MTPEEVAQPPNQYQIFRSFIGKLADSSEKGKGYMFKLLLVAMIGNSLLAIFIVDAYGRFNGWMILFVLICFVPTMLTYILYSRLSALCELPEQMDQVQANVGGLNTALRDSGVMSDLNQFISKNDLGFKGRIKILVKIAPSLVKLKSSIDDVLQVDVIFTLLSVGNPLFAGLFVGAVVPVAIWTVATTVAMLLWIL